MSFEPDILVTSADSMQVLMVVETKMGAKAGPQTSEQMKAYMVSLGAPLGLLVRPEYVTVFQDSFAREGTSAIEEVGDFHIPELQAERTEAAFEEAVQDWLEGLPSKASPGNWDAETWEAVSDYLLPALRLGAVRAAHPRKRSA